MPSRILNPGVGEVVDRMTILKLKMQYSSPSLQNFREEEDELQGWLAERIAGLPEERQKKVYDRWGKLAKINADVWEWIDQIRATPLRPWTVRPLARLAKQVSVWNELRATIIADINTIVEGTRNLNDKVYAELR